MKTVTVGPNVVGDKFVGSRIIQWDSMSKEDVNAFSSSQDAVKNEHHCTGELTERRKEDILAPAGHPELNVNFSKSKGASIKKENISDASPLLKKRAEVNGGGSWSDFWNHPKKKFRFRARGHFLGLTPVFGRFWPSTR